MPPKQMKKHVKSVLRCNEDVLAAHGGLTPYKHSSAVSFP